tara:strand:- start:20768 stop:21205 length:438 start_codon:yes stop_codon:yes gene_type:complete
MAQEGRNVSEYNLNEQGVGLFHHINGKVYDPVSFFPEGGSTPLIGKKEFALMYDQVEYFFANAKNMKTFLTDPLKYEPTYGGWCARAMVVGSKIDIKPEYFTVDGRRIFFFVNSRAKRFFDRDIKGNAAQADAHWKRISGESPRL